MVDKSTFVTKSPDRHQTVVSSFEFQLVTVFDCKRNTSKMKFALFLVLSLSAMALAGKCLEQLVGRRRTDDRSEQTKPKTKTAQD